MAGAKNFLDDLLNLEVNTIVKSGMTGRKMPALGHALIDIFSDYDSWLGRHSGALNEQWSEFRGTAAAADFLRDTVDKHDTSEWWIVVPVTSVTSGTSGTSTEIDRVAAEPSPVGGFGLIEKLAVEPLFDPDKGITADEFDRLRRRARTAEEVYGVLDRNRRPVETGADVMLRRIIRNCDQLKAILVKSSTTGGTATLSRKEQSGAANATADKLSTEDVITIRKAWEMGTEVVALQTVIQLDGDIVTRINDAYRARHNQSVRDLHSEGVSNALEHWQFLVKTVESLVTSGLGRLTGRS